MNDFNYLSIHNICFFHCSTRPQLFGDLFRKVSNIFINEVSEINGIMQTKPSKQGRVAPKWAKATVAIPTTNSQTIDVGKTMAVTNVRNDTTKQSNAGETWQRWYAATWAHVRGFWGRRNWCTGGANWKQLDWALCGGKHCGACKVCSDCQLQAWAKVGGLIAIFGGVVERVAELPSACDEKQMFMV